ncbi:alpha/beta fold hydrolase [Pseudonocardia spirodelae]|uniref:Alpha/beta hydrolase n=1 Tax=Pseudonocardia spirodelae TaxID=3133431 RepID=A0ABU8TDA5_9PSEU
MSLFPTSFTARTVDAGGTAVHTLVGGDGPPLLLLHGYPQTHVIWHRVAPLLAERFTVVATDLRGYGDSAAPPPGPGDAAYAKRAMAADQLAVMAALGFGRFAVAGHDRGGRVAHRLALDAPHAVSALAVLDIVPTRHALDHADARFGHGYWHWFFLTAPAGIPERLIGHDPEFWITARMRSRHHGGTPFDERAIAEYVRCLTPDTIAASCADYRAAAGIDREHDGADAARRVTAPLLALWGAHSFVGRTYDVPAVWREHAQDVRGVALDADHYLPEERPEEVARELTAFLSR